MAATSWSHFLPDVLVNAMGCSDILAENAIKRAAIELCEFSLANRVTLDAQDTEVGNPYVDMAYDGSTDVVRVLDVHCGGKRIFASAPETLAEYRDDWASDTGIPTHYFADTAENAIRLYPKPDSVFATVIQVAVQPKATSTGIDSVIAGKYYDGIVSGALARLCSIPGQAWSDPNVAMLHADRFEKSKLKAQADAIKAFSRAPLRSQAVTK